MTDLSFDELLTKMSSVAEAVNKFSSEPVQQMAFTVLMQRIGVPVTDDEEHVSEKGSVRRSADKKIKASHTIAKKSKAAKKVVTADKSLNLRPEGKVSFREFAEEKQPSSMNERNVVAVYYLTDTLELENISLAHVLACYRDASWKLPTDIVNSMQSTASKTAWVDSSDQNNLLLTSPGRNAVEFDLPKVK